MKYIKVFMLFFCFVNVSKAMQEYSSDSLEIIARSYMRASEEFVFVNKDSSKLFACLAADCFWEAQNTKMYLYCLGGYVNIEAYYNNYSHYRMLFNWYEILVHQYSPDDVLLKCNLLNSKARVFKMFGKLDDSQNALQKAISIMDGSELKLYDKSALYHANLAGLLFDVKDYERSKDEIEIAINLLLINDINFDNLSGKYALATYYFRLAKLNLHFQDLESAEYNFLRSFKYYGGEGKNNTLNQKLNDYTYEKIKYGYLDSARKSFSQIALADLINYSDTLNYYYCQSKLFDRKNKSGIKYELFEKVLNRIIFPVEKEKEVIDFLRLRKLEIQCEQPRKDKFTDIDSLYSEYVLNSNDFNIPQKFDFLLDKMSHNVQVENCLNPDEFLFLKTFLNEIISEIQTQESKFEIQKQIHDFQSLVFENININDLPNSILFDLFEFNKSLVLLSEVGKHQNPKVSSNDLRNELIGQRKFLNHINEELANLEAKDPNKWNEIDSTISSNLKFELSKAKNDLDFLENEYYNKYPNEKYFQDTVLIESSLIQNSLKSSEVLIETFWTETSVNFLFFSSDKMHQFTLNGQDFESFSELVSKLDTNNSASNDEDIFLQLSKLLNLENLEILNGKSRLIIVPDGPLNNLPFELLQRNGSRLLNKFSISYQYSYKLLMVLREQQFVRDNTNEFLGVSFPTNESIASSERLCDDLELLQLSCAKSEIAKIENILSLENSQSDLSTNDFITSAKDARIIHIASHACPDEENHQLSRIHFKDDYLTNYDISAMNLTADLAVLSACETGYGKIIEGEGAMTIARAFFHAGVKTNIVSLWKVDDCSTADLMNYFYIHLRAGDDSDVALRKAKLDFLEKSHPQYHHPYYWAGFIHMGDTSPIFPKNKTIIYLLFAAIGIITFGISVKGYHSAKQNAA